MRVPVAGMAAGYVAKNDSSEPIRGNVVILARPFPKFTPSLSLTCTLMSRGDSPAKGRSDARWKKVTPPGSQQ